VTVVAISSGQLKQGEEKGKKSKEQVDFYRFQMRQAKRERLADLRRKFMEDKAKIAKMKESRKFRPY
jgi:ribosomal RNA-processing protein 7